MKAGFLYLFTGIFCAWAIVWAWQGYSNHLGRYEEWTATKATHDIDLMGSRSFVTSPQALSTNRLNLNAWHGFQELWKALRPDKEVFAITFDFYLDHDAYLVFWWGDAQDSRPAVIFSNRQDRTGGLVSLAASGFFESSFPIGELAALGRGWHHAVLTFIENDKTSLSLNGETAGIFPATSRAPAAIGFRSGKEQVLVDNVAVKYVDGMLTYEPFINWDGFGLRFALALIAFLLYLAAMDYAIRGVDHRQHNHWGLRLALCTSLSLLATGFHIGLHHIYTTRYPDFLGTVAFLDETFQENLKAQFQDTFRQRYGTPETNNGKQQILFIGSSQTWGAGASREEATFVHQVETRLRANGLPHIQCLNGGVRAARSHWAAEVYESWLHTYQPAAVIITFSSNDREWRLFERSLHAIGRISHQRNVPLVFVCEPESAENSSDLELFHDIMRKAGLRWGAPIVEAHDFLKSRHDTGLLWWDYVHPTDYGHELLARAIEPVVRELLQEGGKQVRPTITRAPRNVPTPKQDTD